MGYEKQKVEKICVGLKIFGGKFQKMAQIMQKNSEARRESFCHMVKCLFVSRGPGAPPRFPQSQMAQKSRLPIIWRVIRRVANYFLLLHIK